MVQNKVARFLWPTVYMSVLSVYDEVYSPRQAV